MDLGKMCVFAPLKYEIVQLALNTATGKKTHEDQLA